MMLNIEAGTEWDATVAAFFGDAFAPFDIRLYVSCRHEPDLVAKGCQFPRPEVGRGAGLHPDQAGRQAAEEADKLASAELAADQNLSTLVNAVDLKDVLGDIKADYSHLHRSGSLSGAEANTLTHRALPGAGAVHPIIYLWNGRFYTIPQTRDGLPITIR